MKHLRTIILNFLFFLHSGKRILSELKFYQKSEYKTLLENLEIQEANLKTILYYSWLHVPYYKKVLEESNVIINGEIHLENFHKIKILDKETLHNNFESLITTDKNHYNRKMYTNTSGGSTGEPTKFIQDHKYRIIETAAKWFYFTFLTDYPCKNITLWGSERDIIKSKLNIKRHLVTFLQQKSILNSFRMTKENMFKYVQIINKKKPKIIESYAQSIYSLAIFIKNNNLRVFSPTGIVTSAGTLYPFMKELIEEVFKCPVLNRYGSREVGDIACSCSKNEGLHVNILNNFVEILDDNFKPVKPGETGKIYVTKLTNFSMPLIRYQIGDIGVQAENIDCSCGRGLPLIKFIEGREMSVFKTRSGTVIPAEFFIHFIGVVYNKGIISKFQVIQDDFDDITIKYILEKSEGFDLYKKQISSSIRKVMDDNVKINWEEVDNIPYLPSGKYLYTISKID